MDMLIVHNYSEKKTKFIYSLLLIYLISKKMRNYSSSPFI